VATNEVSDLSRREADIAVRSFRPEQPELVARKIRDGRGWAYGTPAYLDSLGNPSVDDDMTGVAFMGFDHTGSLIAGLAPLGLTCDEANFPLVTASHLVQWAMARQGLGLCLMIEQIGDLEPGLPWHVSHHRTHVAYLTP
jgi:DNA-binding transcriptional LysR family regulator